MGTCAVSIKKRSGLGPTGQVRIVDISLSASYATGGDTLTPGSCDLTTIDAVVLTGASPTSGVVLAVAHGATTKIKAHQDNAVAGASPLGEVAAASNQSTHTVRAVVYGDLTHI